jgi:hypothetical protein
MTMMMWKSRGSAELVKGRRGGEEKRKEMS